MKTLNNNLFPLDKITFEDLEIFPSGPNKVAFTQAYYYCPVLAKNQIEVKFNKIKNTFNPVTERPEKFFDLKEDEIKHFYIKVILKDEKIKIDEPPDTTGEGEYYTDLNFGFKKYFEADTVEISDDVICQPSDIGYPMYEKIDTSKSILPELSFENPYQDGETTKFNTDYGTVYPSAFNKLNKVFYIYLCSLKYKEGELYRLFYYLLRNSKDPSIIVPEPIEFVLNNKHRTEEQNNKEIILKDARGQEYLKYKESDIDASYFVDRVYRKRNALFRSIWKDMSYTEGSFVDYGVLTSPKDVAIGTQASADWININPLHLGIAKGQSPPGFTHDDFTYSPFPIVGISTYAFVTKFTPAET